MVDTTTTMITPVNAGKRKYDLIECTQPVSHSPSPSRIMRKQGHGRVATAPPRQPRLLHQSSSPPTTTTTKTMKFSTPTPSIRRKRASHLVVSTASKYHVTYKQGSNKKSTMTTTTKQRSQQHPADSRFIPNRSGMNLDLCRMALFVESSTNEGCASDSDSGGGRRQQRNDRYPYAEPIVSSRSLSFSSSPELALKEYQRRMLSSLCNIPCHTIDDNLQPKSLFHFSLTAGGGAGRAATRRSVTSSSESTFNNNNNHHHPNRLDILRALELFESIGDDSYEANPTTRVLKRTMNDRSCRRNIDLHPTSATLCDGIMDDYYTNLTSWSVDNILAIGTSDNVALWNRDTDDVCFLVNKVNPSTGEVQHFMDGDSDYQYVTSVSWCTVPGKTHWLAVGSCDGTVYVYDTVAMRRVHVLYGHHGSVSAMSWNGCCLASAGRDCDILLNDIRTSPYGGTTKTYRAHESTVCSLTWDDMGRTLASGSDDNTVCIWDGAMSGRSSSTSRTSPANDHYPRLRFREHAAAVKALDWSPFSSSILASGGGIDDRTIKIWNCNNGNVLSSTATGSQVSSVLWSRNYRERGAIVSSHQNGELNIWRYTREEPSATVSSLQKLCELEGHSGCRILNMSMSPDGGTVVSIGADEQIKFWDFFGLSSRKSFPSKDFSLVLPSLGMQSIR